MPMLAVGNYRFSDPALEATRSREGDAAAWQSALERSPEEAAHGVCGDFAVVLQDAKGRVFMAVDRFAVRSLCYRIGPDGLRWAQRACDLAQPEDELDPQAIYDYLYFHAIPSPRTVFKPVFRLPPGHCAVFEQGRLDVRRYWRPQWSALADADFGALRQEFRGLLREAVAMRLDRSRPACFLSGGTDSSTVASLASELTGPGVDTYSMGFEAEGYDEMAYARIAARRFGTRHHEHYVTPDELVAHIPSVAAHYDQPFGNSSALPAYICQLRARQDGIDVLLAGDGGDELFGGNTRYATQRLFGLYARIPAKLRHALLEPMLLRSPVGRAPLARKAASYIRQAQVPLPQRLQTYNQLERLGPIEMLCPGLLSAVDPLAPLRHQQATWLEADAPNDLERMLAFDWRYTLAENDLPKVCGTAALAGMRVGFPMLDDRLVDFSLRLPSAYKLRGFTLRWFFKRALDDLLPREILTKKKHGFGLPFGVWMMRHDGLKRLATESVMGLSSRGVIQEAFARSLLSQRMPEHPGYYGEAVWVLMMLEQWLRHHRPHWRYDKAAV